MRGALLPLLLACTLALPYTASADPAADPEIEYLLEFVATSGCIFVRNGDDHDAADAADHLRLKLDRGKRYVNSAEQFIERLATESSWSGVPYTVTCAGKTQTSADCLYHALAEYRPLGSAQAADST